MKRVPTVNYDNTLVLRKRIQYICPTSSNMLDQKCWTRLLTMLDDVRTTFISQKMLDESLKQFKHSRNILFLSYRVSWCSLRLRALPTCWTNIHVKKKSISLKFEHFNVRMLISLWIEFCFSKFIRSLYTSYNYFDEQ